MKFRSNVRNALQQQFMSIRGLGRDASAVLIHDHPCHGTEMLVHEWNRSTEAPADSTESRYCSVSENRSRFLLQISHVLRNGSPVSRQQLIAQAGFMPP